MAFEPVPGEARMSADSFRVNGELKRIEKVDMTKKYLVLADAGQRQAVIEFLAATASKQFPQP
jgi:hypothetical protein